MGIRALPLRIVALAALLAVSASSLTIAAPAHADAITAKRRQAARLADSIDALGERISILAEDYNSATVRLAQLRQAITKAKKGTVLADTQLSAVEQRVRARAVREYVDPVTGLSDAATTDLSEAGQIEAGQRAVLRSIATGNDDAVLEDLRAAREDLTIRKRAVVRAEAAEGAVSKTLAQRRGETEGLLVRQRKLLDQTKGELGKLIVEEERRRSEAEARRVKAELSRRQAAAFAAFQKALAQAAKDRARNGAIRAPFDPRAARQAAAQAAGTGNNPLVIPDLGNDPPATRGAATAIAFARTQLGKPYQWGGAGPNSYDCSGLLLVAWRAAGRSVPHSSRALWSMTTHVPASTVRPGDLVFYGSPIHHVGMYVGNGQMIESPRTGLNVRISSIFRRGLVGVGRL